MIYLTCLLGSSAISFQMYSFTDCIGKKGKGVEKADSRSDLELIENGNLLKKDLRNIHNTFTAILSSNTYMKIL